MLCWYSTQTLSFSEEQVNFYLGFIFFLQCNFTPLTHAGLTVCKVTLHVHIGCHMINGPRGTGVARNTVTFALLASSEPKVAGRSWWQYLPVLGHLCRRMRVYVCVHLKWIITPLDASGSAKWEDRSACAFMSKTSHKLVAVCVRCLCASVAFAIITSGSSSTLAPRWENPDCPLQVVRFVLCLRVLSL